MTKQTAGVAYFMVKFFWIKLLLSFGKNIIFICEHNKDSDQVEDKTGTVYKPKLTSYVT